jgi:hypothetical protein
MSGGAILLTIGHFGRHARAAVRVGLPGAGAAVDQMVLTEVATQGWMGETAALVTGHRQFGRVNADPAGEVSCTSWIDLRYVKVRLPGVLPLQPWMLVWTGTPHALHLAGQHSFVQRLWRDDTLAVEAPVDPAGGA